MTAIESQSDPEYMALLESVRANPDDDAIRLIISDWLEENGEEERAEFIRVQIELVHYIKELRAGRAKGRQMVGWTDGHLKDLYREVGNLWVSCRDSVCGGVLPVDCVSIYESDNRFGVDTVVSRGFVESVSMTCEQFCGGPCQACGDYTETEQLIFESRGTPCNRCGGTGHIEGVARELFERHPITAVRLVGISPRLYPDGIAEDRYGAGQYFFSRSIGIAPYGDNRLPGEIFQYLTGYVSGQLGSAGGGFYGYRTEAAALDALSAACVALGRKRAGLPALEGVGR